MSKYTKIEINKLSKKEQPILVDCFPANAIEVDSRSEDDIASQIIENTFDED